MAITLTGWNNAKVWEKMLWTEANDELWWKNWISDDKSNIFERNTDLTKQQGEKIEFGLLPRVTDEGVTNDTAMEGSEQSMTFYGDDVTITQYKQAVINTGNYKSQIIPFNDLFAMKEALKVWAAERLDGLFFTAFDAGTEYNTTNNILTVDASTTKATAGSMTLAKNELLLADIRKLPFYARQRRINPLRIKGKNYFVFLMHDDAAGRLQSVDPSNTQSWYQSMLHAQERSGGNPLFEGAMGVVGSSYAGVILHSHNNTALFGTTSGPECYSLLLGAQAGIYGLAQPVDWTQKLFQYDKQVGVQAAFMCGVGRSIFNTEEHGVISVRHYAPQLTF